MNLGLCAVDSFVLLSHGLIYFESLTCCIACAAQAASDHHQPKGVKQLDLEKINMLWTACIYLAVLTLTHEEAREVPYKEHAHLEHEIWSVL